MLYDCLFNTVHDISTNVGYTEARSMFLTATKWFHAILFSDFEYMPFIDVSSS